MKGRIRDYSPQSSSGVITGSDGGTYTFLLSDWREAEPPAAGIDVDFVVAAGRATSVYRATGSSYAGSGAGAGAGVGGSSGSGYSGSSARSGGSSNAGSGSRSVKSRGTAAVLALFLGWTGAHKFYLGYPAQGMATLIVGVTGLLAWSIPLVYFNAITVHVVEFVANEFPWYYRDFDGETLFFVISPTVISTMIWVIVIGALVHFTAFAVSLIECVTYVSKSDRQFDDAYAEGRRVWF